MIANKKKETIFLQTVAGCQMKKNVMKYAN